MIFWCRMSRIYKHLKVSNTLMMMLVLAVSIHHIDLSMSSCSVWGCYMCEQYVWHPSHVVLFCITGKTSKTIVSCAVEAMKLRGTGEIGLAWHDDD